MTAPSTATQVARRLVELVAELDDTVNKLEGAEKIATEKRRGYDLAYAHEFLAADGAMDVRRYTAVLNTAELRNEAEVAELVVRHLKREINVIEKRIEVGRSYGAAVRAEVGLAGTGVTP